MSEPTPLKLEIYYDTRTKIYWLRLAPNRFIPLSSNDCKMHMMKSKFNIHIEDRYGLKSGDNELVKCREESYVDYAGPLAGHKCGLFTNKAGSRILVTSEATHVEPIKGRKFNTIQKYLGLLLGDHQLLPCLLWLKIAWETLNRGQFRPGQLVVLAGEGGCGKSFFHVLVTMLLGGRSAKPYRYMTGQTKFNSELAGAESLVIEDENAKATIAARREFGTSIKDWTVNEEISVHAKGREAITLGFFRRVTLSVNWETEYLMILPPMDHSILDKITLFKVHDAKAALSEDREENIAMLKRELPGFICELKGLRVPKSHHDARFGVRAYHNPEILEVLSDVSPETRLDDLINQVLKFDDDNIWSGTAMELEQVLAKSEFSYQVDKLLSYSSACGTFLARLASKKPDRFKYRKNRGRTVWSITKGNQ